MAQANADIDGLKARFSKMQNNQNTSPQNTTPQEQKPATTASQANATPQKTTAAPQETTQSPAQNPPQGTQAPSQATSQQNPPPVQEGTKSPLDALQGVENQKAGEETKPPVNVVEVEGEHNAVVGEQAIPANVVSGEQNPTTQNAQEGASSAIQTKSEPVTDETIIEESLEDLREEYDDAKLNSVIIEQVKELIEIDNNLNNKLEDLRVDLKKEVEEREKLNKKIDDNYSELKELEKSIDKFIALYELVTNQFNPFVKQGEGETQEKMENLMKDVKQSEEHIQEMHHTPQQPTQNVDSVAQNVVAQPNANSQTPQEKTDFHFETKNGLRVNTLAQLIDAIKNMSDGEFLHHVSDTKNDFATWIAGALRNPTLAQKIKSLKTEEEILANLQ